MAARLKRAKEKPVTAGEVEDVAQAPVAGDGQHNTKRRALRMNDDCVGKSNGAQKDEN
jgi:hypothetical protein